MSTSNVDFDSITINTINNFTLLQLAAELRNADLALPERETIPSLQECLMPPNRNYRRTMQWLLSANANGLHPIKETIFLGQASCGSQGENSPHPQGGHYFAAHGVFLAMEQAVEYREAH
ncbi:hypothetical protein LTR56_003797 [Elasticomyces elasticus]|nr:hypothetical protein LTR22_013144 [Elasticomyces elasticus]KAK3654939.1 hypothetical protein LTR56_003797 [Elasticomyces elasticus]KAK4928731.1 hypothetical protein LTR49_004540 [Elasticomyces elasticus]KAK5766642.1 hypothetical protein LTS12_003261 [Elasticomyces elasticus]